MKNRLFLKILFQFWDTRFFVPCVAFGSPWPPGRHCELKNCEKPMFFNQFDFAVPARNFCCYTQYFRPLAARRLLGAGRLGGPAEPNMRIWIEPGPRPRRCQGQQFLFRLLFFIFQQFLGESNFTCIFCFLIFISPHPPPTGNIFSPHTLLKKT